MPASLWCCWPSSRPRRPFGCGAAAADSTGSGPAEEQVEAAWAEISDTVVDYGGSWPDGSPRAIGDEIAHRLDEEESESMSRVATLVERSRYARSFDQAAR